MGGSFDPDHLILLCLLYICTLVSLRQVSCIGVSLAKTIGFAFIDLQTFLRCHHSPDRQVHKPSRQTYEDFTNHNLSKVNKCMSSNCINISTTIAIEHLLFKFIPKSSAPAPLPIYIFYLESYQYHASTVLDFW